MRRALLVLPCLAACLREPTPPPLLFVSLSPRPLAAPQYVLTTTIGNFDPARQVMLELSYGRDDAKQADQQVTLGPLDDETAAVFVELDPDADYHARVRAVPAEGYDRMAEAHWRTGPWVLPPEAPVDPSLPLDPPLPPEDGASPDLTDGGTVRVVARHMEDVASPDMFLRFRSSAKVAETIVRLAATHCDQGGCEGVLPPLMTRPGAAPFIGALPKARIYYDRPGVGTLEGGATLLRYRMAPPVPATGAPGAEFSVELFHRAHAPELPGLTVLFDDTPLRPIAAEDVATTLVVWPAISSRSRYRVPDDAAPGVHHLRAVTAFGDEFLSSDDRFVVP
jgi:hypothetical protein